MGKWKKEKQDERGMMGERDKGREEEGINGRGGSSRNDGREGREEGRERKGGWMKERKDG